MKRKGSKVECSDERMLDLMRLYRNQIKISETISHNVFCEIVNKPSRRFWVSGKRAAVVISAIMQGDNILSKMRTPKREMYNEIYARAVKIKKQNPTLSMLEICESVIEEPAPKIYLSPGSAKIMVYKYLQKKTSLNENNRRNNR